MAQRQRIYGRFTADPFAALKQKQKKIDEYSELKGKISIIVVAFHNLFII
jgi:hypothetical protein